jgi:ATP-dependent RNA helicase DDX23/PRP28
MKASEKFRFNFDWDSKEDTSKDLNPLYNEPHGKGQKGRGGQQGRSVHFLYVVAVKVH